jgi:hypothetical protein
LIVALGSVGLIATFCGVLLGLSRDRSPLPVPPPIPDPNGYDDVLEAGRAIEKTGLTGPRFDVAKAGEAELEAVVRGTREAVDRGRRGLELKFQVPVVYDLDHLMNVLMKDLGSIRGGMARALLAQGRLDELQDRPDLAASSYADAIRLGDALSHRVPMIAYYVGVAVESTGLHHLRDVREKLSPEECRKMIALLEAIDQDPSIARDTLVRETAFMNSNIKKMGAFASMMTKLTGVQAKSLTQVTTSLDSAENRVRAARRLLLTELALRVYEHENGGPASELIALVPSILKSVPIDPYNDRALRYQLRGKKGIPYSFGPDRDDDMLTKTLGQRHLDSTDGDYTIDSF